MPKHKKDHQHKGGIPAEAEGSPILFGGTPVVPSAETFAAARERNPLWYQILEKAYQQFAKRPENVGILADPKGKGATVGQVGLVFSTFLGYQPYCILARSLPEKQLARLDHVVKYSPPELVEALKRLQLLNGGIYATTLHHDGKTGHAITIMSYSSKRDRFIYHDPWPLKSLLCEENNMAGVKAQQEEGKRWSVTSEELERVVFASFVFPHLWARLQGIKFDLEYGQWVESDFFKFFHMKLVTEETGKDSIHRTFAPGPFKDSILLVVEIGKREKIAKAGLFIKKGWIAANLPLALDISKSFIDSFAPSPERETYGKISAAVRKLRDPEFVQAMKAQPADESPEDRCVRAFMGAVESASLSTSFGNLAIGNVVKEQLNILALEFTLY